MGAAHGSLLSEGLIGVLIALGIAFAIFRQLRPRRASLRSFILIPAVAVYALVQSWPQTPPTGAIELELIVTVLICAGIGYWQAAATQVLQRADGLFLKGGASYLLAWVALLAVRFGLRYLFEGAQGLAHMNESMWLVWVEVAVAWISRNAFVLWLHPEVRSHLTGMAPRPAK